MKRILVLSALLWVSCLQAASTPTAELGKLDRAIATTKKTVTVLETKQAAMTAELRAIELQLGKTVQRFQKLLIQAKNSIVEVAKLQEKRDVLKTELTQQQAALNTQLRGNYMLNRQSLVKLLLNNSSPKDAMTSLGYYRYINQYRANAITQLLALVDEVNQAEIDLQNELSAQRNLKTKQSKTQLTLNAELSVRQKLLKKINSRLRTVSQKLVSLRKGKKALQAVIAKVQRQKAAMMVRFSKLRGRLPWPAEGRVAKQYGDAIAKTQMQWKGILIRAPEGAPVHAVAPGKVVFADWLRGFGLLIIVEHDKHYMSLYAHNANLFRRQGEKVKRGEEIATVGRTGGFQQAGLYFELRKDGRPFNPKAWLQQHV